MDVASVYGSVACHLCMQRVQRCFIDVKTLTLNAKPISISSFNNVEQTDGRTVGHLLPRLGVAFIWHRFKRERLVNGSNSCHRFLGFYFLLCCFFCGSLTFDLNFVALENVLKINPTRIHHSSFIKQTKKKRISIKYSACLAMI